eukprot:10378878-Karenia_brevis.AAC.1
MSLDISSPVRETYRLLPEDVRLRYSLVCSADSQSAGMLAINCMKAQRLRVHGKYDPCHRDWNDVKRAVERCGLKRVCLCFSDTCDNIMKF